MDLQEQLTTYTQIRGRRGVRGSQARGLRDDRSLALGPESAGRTPEHGSFLKLLHSLTCRSNR